MKLKNTAILTMILIFTFSFTAYPHSGRTDANGGHRDNNNVSGLGSYHYHHGYEAHLHPDGICPYASAGTSNTQATSPEPVPEPQQSSDPDPAPSPAIKVLLSGEEILFSQSPILLNGRVLVPIRNVVEKINCHVRWDPETQTVYVNNSHTPLTKNALPSDTIGVYVDNEEILFDNQAPVNINGNILLPLRPVMEKLGYTISWNEDTQIVIIEKTPE